jgi:ubiquinone/menaquinone biosynthesis C-methylase UbiE
MLTANPIIETYSRLADKYDNEANLQSCWGRAAEKALASLRLADHHKMILDVGCGTGRALVRLASNSKRCIQFIGIDPAKNIRERAIQRTKDYPNIRILDGCFEQLPIETGSIDYLYSIFAFHWTTDLHASVNEISRVLKRNGEMDLFFIGRNNGREFIQKTTSIFLKYLGPAQLLRSARLRKQLTKEGVVELFATLSGRSQFLVEESYDTYYDTLEGHWGWWVRIEGHFIELPAQKKQDCDREVRDALQGLEEDSGIPYTVHQLHVQLRYHQ